jgi:hypothetical protein
VDGGHDGVEGAGLVVGRDDDQRLTHLDARRVSEPSRWTLPERGVAGADGSSGWIMWPDGTEARCARATSVATLSSVGPWGNIVVYEALASGQ